MPELGVFDIEAKIDTGAATSALHVERLEISVDGVASFVVIQGRGPTKKLTLASAPIQRYVSVRSSNGATTTRCAIRTKAVIGPVSKTIELTLVNREKMDYRMLLGRQALRGAFVVDVGHHGFPSAK